MMLTNIELLGLRELVLKRIFRPEKDRWDDWLIAYAKTIDGFLELDNNSSCTHRHNELKFGSSVQPLNFTISISETDEFNASLSIGDESLWMHHVDNAYRTVNLDGIVNIKKSKEIVKKIGENHIRKILDDLLFHPEVHQHIEIPELSHIYRIGGGISNVFQFLIHLRFQMCPEEYREKEITRLTNIIFDHIRSRGFNSIDIGELLDIKKHK